MIHRFVRSAYWGKWSLVLTTRHVGERQRTLATLTGQTPSPSTIEVDLEPVNGWNRCTEAQMRAMRGINVRRHCTARDARDVLADRLPMAVEAALAEHLGAATAAWLLDPATEILGLIDWRRFDAVCNGGSPLRDCVHPHLAHLLPAQDAADRFAQIADAIGRGGRLAA